MHIFIFLSFKYLLQLVFVKEFLKRKSYSVILLHSLGKKDADKSINFGHYRCVRIFCVLFLFNCFFFYFLLVFFDFFQHVNNLLFSCKHTIYFFKRLLKKVFVDLFTHHIIESQNHLFHLVLFFAVPCQWVLAILQDWNYACFQFFALLFGHKT